jgi:nitrite reductase/ring-hydroxylating ferredoxin subunit
VKELVFVKVAETSEIPLEQMKAFKLAEKEILVANVNNVYYAIGNICTPMNGYLSKGTLKGNIVTCPKHKAKFDVTTGKVISGPKTPLFHPKINDEPTYQVKVEGNVLLLKTE